MKSKLVLSVSLLVLLAGAEAQAQQRLPEYTITILGTLGGASSEAFSINNSGWASGVSNLQGNQTQHAFLWRRGEMIDLGTLGGPNSVVLAAHAKNDRGLIAGQAETSIPDPLNENFCGFGTNLTCLGFVWQNGVMNPLPTLGGTNAQAFGVNSRGEVAGLAETDVQDPSCVLPQVLDYKAVIWGPKAREIHELPSLPGGSVAAAIAINDNGQVVGASLPCGPVNPSASHRAVLWQKGTVTDLGTLGGTTNNVALAINNHAQVVGFSNLAGDVIQHAFFWQDGVLKDLGTLPGDVLSLASGINDRGQVVGGSCDVNSNCKAVIWQDGTMTDLNTIVPLGSLPLIFASDISSRGEIVGQAFDQSTGVSPAFLAIPCNEDDSSKGCEDAALDTALVSQRPQVVLPDNIREQLRQRLGFGRFGAMPKIRAFGKALANPPGGVRVLTDVEGGIEGDDAGQAASRMPASSRPTPTRSPRPVATVPHILAHCSSRSRGGFRNGATRE